MLRFFFHLNEMSLSRFLFCFWGLGLFLLPDIVRAESQLDAVVDWRYDAILNTHGKNDALSEIGVQLGLSQTTLSWLTFSGAVGVHYAWGWNEPLSYHYQLALKQTRNVWGVGLHGAVSVHLPSELLGVSGGLSVRSFFIPSRSGIFRCDAFVGLRFKVSMTGILRGALFVIHYHFPLFDDFKTVFDLSLQDPSLSFGVGWQF